jgi:hypothetical protein
LKGVPFQRLANEDLGLKSSYRTISSRTLRKFRLGALPCKRL